MRIVIAATALASLLLSAKAKATPVDSDNIYFGPLVQVRGNGGDQTLTAFCPHGGNDRVLYVSCWTDDSTATLLSAVQDTCRWNNHGSTRGYRRAYVACVGP
jgi:hypothetical protein